MKNITLSIFLYYFVTFIYFLKKSKNKENKGGFCGYKSGYKLVTNRLQVTNQIFSALS